MHVVLLGCRDAQCIVLFSGHSLRFVWPSSERLHELGFKGL